MPSVTHRRLTLVLVMANLDENGALITCGVVSRERLPRFLAGQLRSNSTTKAFDGRPSPSVTKPSAQKAPGGENAGGYTLTKPTVFLISFSTACFTGATIWQYENMRLRARAIIGTPKKWFAEKLEPFDLRIREKLGNYSRTKRGSVRQICNTWWNSLSDGQRLFLGILVINVAVYLAWKLPRLQPVMSQYFVSTPSSRAVCWPMLLCTFSHHNGLHLAANMFVLNSFISGAVSNLGKEQFLGFYLVAGVFSSWVSIVYRVITKDALASLGASGAIMGIIGYTCTKYPDTMLSIIFLPFFAFKAGIGIKVLMAVDFSSLLLKFRLFDHAAHLGGALFGLFWCYWGNMYIWQKRGRLLQWWHGYRSRPN